MTASSPTALGEAELRERCAALAAELPDQPAIRRIAFVGAIQCVLGGKDMDSVRMTHALDYLLRSDLVIDPGFAIDVINLYHGRDFLAEDGRADLVFVSFVPNVEHRLFARLDPSLLQEQRDSLAAGGTTRDPAFFWQARSTEHSAEAWRARTAATGARLVLTIGGRKEICTQVLEGSGYQTLVPTPAWECQPPYRGWSREQLYGGIAWDVPYKWLGVLAHDSVLAASSQPGARRPARTMLAAEIARRTVERAPSAPSPDP